MVKLNLFKLKSLWVYPLIIFALFIISGVSIKCWICSSRTDPKCGDPFVNESLPLNDCAQDPKKPKTPTLTDVKATMCRKMRQKVEGEWMVIRSCAYLGQPGEGTGNENVCHYQTDSYDVFVETCTCNSKDGCNFGLSLSNNYFKMALIILLGLALTYCH